MKKKFIQAALAAMFCLAVGYSVYTAQKKNGQLSDTMLENVEALANGESSLAFCINCRADVYWDCLVTRDGTYIAYCPYMRGF